MTCHNLWAEELLLDIFSDHTVNADKRSVHTNKPGRPEAKPLAPFKADVMRKGMNCD